MAVPVIRFRFRSIFERGKGLDGKGHRAQVQAPDMRVVAETAGNHQRMQGILSYVALAMIWFGIAYRSSSAARDRWKLASWSSEFRGLLVLRVGAGFVFDDMHLTVLDS